MEASTLQKPNYLVPISILLVGLSTSKNRFKINGFSNVTFCRYHHPIIFLYREIADLKCAFNSFN